MGATLFYATFLEGFSFKKYKLVKLGVCFVRDERDLPDRGQLLLELFSYMAHKLESSHQLTTCYWTSSYIWGSLSLASEWKKGISFYAMWHFTKQIWPFWRITLGPLDHVSFLSMHAIFQDLKQGGLAFDIYPRDLANDISGLLWIGSGTRPTLVWWEKVPSSHVCPCAEISLSRKFLPYSLPYIFLSVFEL